MNIIIVGAGKVGQSLCSELSEHHDIVIIEKDADLIDRLMNKFDITGLVGSGTDMQTLVEAGVKTVDIFIAATQLDEVNLISCALAKYAGAKNTVARVRNPEYVRGGETMKSAFGIDLVINPELSAARDIARALRYASALSVQPLGANRVSLVEIEVLAGSPLDHLSLSDFRLRYGSVIVCIIEREGVPFIPSGTNVLRSGDKIFVAGMPKDMTSFHRNSQNQEKNIKSALIIGGGKIAHYLLKLLEHTHISVKVIESNVERCEQISSDYPYARVIHGDGTDTEVLDEQGIQTYDSLVSLTGVDEENLIVSIYGAQQGVRKVITKLSRINLLTILDTTMLKKIVSPKHLVASEIARFVRSRDNAQGSDVEALYRVANNQVEVLQFKVNGTYSKLGQTLSQISLKSNVLIAYILRQNKVIFPQGKDSLQADDRVVVVTTHKDFTNLEDILEG